MALRDLLQAAPEATANREVLALILISISKSLSLIAVLSHKVRAFAVEQPYALHVYAFLEKTTSGQWAINSTEKKLVGIGVLKKV